MGGEAEQFLRVEHSAKARRRLSADRSAECDQLQAVLRDLWLIVGLTNIADQARGSLVVVGLMVERAKALGLDDEALEYCAQEIRLAVSDLIQGRGADS